MAEVNSKNSKHLIPILAIVGRPNVGKSSLFNRLIGKRLAITSEIAGTTRDRIYFHTSFNEIPAILVDTGGLDYGKKENIENDVQAQADLAIHEADLIYFILDGKEQLTRNDLEAADKLRKSHGNIMIIANKVDGKIEEQNLAEFNKLGFGEPMRISAYHNIGVDELIQTTGQKLIESGFQKIPHQTKSEKVTNICFIGKPNVGKSSLVNAIFGKPKVIVSEIPGTTRDTTDTEITWNDQKYNLIDTAGLRRRGKIERGLEKLSSFRSLQAIDRADVACLVLDYSEGIRKQDQHLASYILEAGKGLMLIINKSDLMKDIQHDESRMINVLRRRFEFLPWAPAIFVSAVKKKNLDKIFEIVNLIQVERFRSIDQDDLNGFMKETIYKSLPPAVHNTRPQFYVIQQVEVNPPTFVFYVNDPTAIHFSYRRYLENELRLRYPFTGTVIKIEFRKNTSK